jgi:hypothetical protein
MRVVHDPIDAQTFVSTYHNICRSLVFAMLNIVFLSIFIHEDIHNHCNGKEKQISFQKKSGFKFIFNFNRLFFLLWKARDMSFENRQKSGANR